MSNVNYWREYGGETYRLQQDQRRSHHRSYAEQEQWLSDYFTKYVANSAKQHCTLLDFGCGFGRIAHLLSGIDGIDYFGFDISTKMTERQGNSPPVLAMTNLSDRVRVGERLEDVFLHGQFDVILTVSVLIHNPPAQVRSILATMFKHLKPDGRIVLIENPHTAVSTIENFWHGGCWCHSFVRDLDGLADVEIFDNFAARHAIYIAKRCDEPQESRFIYHADQHARGETMPREALLLRGLQRASINAEHLSTEAARFSDDRPGLIAQVHDLSELLSEKERELSLSKARFYERQKLLEDLAIVSNEARRRHAPATNSDEPQTADPELTKQVQWNARRDCAYSQALPEFARTLSVFHQEWFGIRAALGSFGGDKLAISADVDLQKERVLQIYERIVSEGFTHIVFHGLSPNACKLLSFLSKRGLG